MIKAIFNEFGTNLAAFLKDFLAIAPAELVVIGGNIAKSYTYFKGTFLQSLQDMNLSKIEIRTALLGEEAALIGAAGCWRNLHTAVSP